MSKFLDETGLAYFWDKIKAALSTVAFTGSYNDLSNKPNIPASSTVDTALSSTSENPIQNKVINTALGTKANDSDVVKLSGNQTINDTKTFSSKILCAKGTVLGTTVDNSFVKIIGGTSNDHGAYISLDGKDSINPGQFSLRAHNGTTSHLLAGRADGTLQWDSKDIAIDENVVHISGDETISGSKTFGSAIIRSSTTTNPTIKTSSNASVIRIWGSAESAKGASLTLVGDDFSGGSNAGYFYLTTGNDASNNRRSLMATPNGSLAWDGKHFVYDTENQTIAGIKVFSNTPRTTAKRAYIINPSATKGTTPSGNQDSGFYFMDNVADATVDSLGTAHIMAEVRNRYGTTGNNTLQFLVYTPTTGAKSSQYVQFRVASDGTGNFVPGANGTIQLGISSARWKEIWCTQASINSSSDERIKQQIADVPDAVLDAWGGVDWIQFKYNDAVAEKGADKARLHNGLIAQRVDAAFKAHGLDASKYGLFLYDTWDAQPEERDDDGTLIHEAQPAGDGYGLRYTEALCMEAAFQRRRADRAESRITALEQRLDEMETVIATLGFSGGDQE